MADAPLDQASGLRKMTHIPKPVKVIAIASGKGGVGKTNVTVNIGVALATQGKKVVLLDADLGLANIDVMLGLHPQFNLLHVLEGDKSLKEIMVDEPASITDAYALIKLLSREHGVERFHIIANMGRSIQEGRELFDKISLVCDRFLDVTLNFMGIVPFDEDLRRAVKKQRSVVEFLPRSKSATAFQHLAKKIDYWPVAKQPRGNMEFFVERLIQASLEAG